MGILKVLWVPKSHCPRRSREGAWAVDESSAVHGGKDRRPRFCDLLAYHRPVWPAPTCSEPAFLLLPGSPVSGLNLGFFSLAFDFTFLSFIHTQGLLTICSQGCINHKFGISCFIGYRLVLTATLVSLSMCFTPKNEVHSDRDRMKGQNRWFNSLSH